LSPDRAVQQLWSRGQALPLLPGVPLLPEIDDEVW